MGGVNLQPPVLEFGVRTRPPTNLRFRSFRHEPRSDRLPGGPSDRSDVRGPFRCRWQNVVSAGRVTRYSLPN